MHASVQGPLCTQILSECTALQQPDRAALWGELLQALLAFLDGQSDSGAAAAAAETDAEDGDEGEVCFVCLLSLFTPAQRADGLLSA